MSEELVMRRIRDLTNSDVVALVAKSDQYMSTLYPPESNHAEPLAALVGDDSAFFAERGPFGSYRVDPLSVFMEKTLHE